MGTERGTDGMWHWGKLALVKVETVTVLFAGWVAQGGIGLEDLEVWERVVVRWGALGLVGMALYRLLWHELPGLREERDRDRKAHRHDIDKIVSALTSLKDEMRGRG